MLEIKNLLFDLGGVIMDIDRLRCIHAYETLGLANASSYFDEYAQTGILGLLESGQISPDDFRTEMHRHLPPNVTDSQIDEALNMFLVRIPPERLCALRHLRQSHRIYLLSNTNPIMWNSAIKSMFEIEGLHREDYFDGIITSFQAKVMKPDPRIFTLTAEKFDINPSETLFFDDSQANVDAAIACGYHSLLVDDTHPFTSTLA